MADALVSKVVQEAPANLTLFGGGPTLHRPQNPHRWFVYFDTNLNFDVVWDGIQWKIPAAGAAGTVPLPGAQGTRGSQGTAGTSIGPGSQGAQGFQGSRGPQGFSA